MGSCCAKSSCCSGSCVGPGSPETSGPSGGRERGGGTSHCDSANSFDNPLHTNSDFHAPVSHSGQPPGNPYSTGGSNNILTHLPTLDSFTNGVIMPYGATGVCTLASHTSDVNGVAFHRSALATCGGDKVLRVWNLDDFTELSYSPLSGHRYSINGCTFSPVNNWLVSYSTDGKAILWDVKTGDQVAVLTHPSQASIRVCRFAPTGDVLATGSDDETLCLWDLTTKKIIRSFEGHEASIPACAFSPDSAFIVCGNVHGYLKVFSTLGRSPNHLFYEMNGHDLGVTCCEFSPTYGSADLDARNPDTSGITANLLPDPEEEVEGVKPSPDAPKVHYLLATCGYDNNIKLWDFVAICDSLSVKLTLRNTLSGHNDSVMDCCFSPDGLLLASAAGDKTVRLWDPLRGEHVYTILGHSRFVTCCAFSIDGKYLASGSNDREVKVWRVGRTDQMAQGPEAVVRRVETASAPQLDTAYYMKDLADWGVDEVCHWLTDLDMAQYVSQFRQHVIDGRELLTLNAELLEKNFNIMVLGHRNKLARAIEELKERPALHQNATANGVPDEFMCPITREIMSDPVIASDGFTYERAAMADWIKRGKSYSPMTNSALSSSSLTPNRSLKMLIQRYLQESK